MKRILGLLIIGLLLIPLEAKALTTTLYCRSDTWTVNGLNTYKLDTTNTNSNLNITTANSTNSDGGGCLSVLGNFNAVDIYVLHSDSSTTLIGSSVANTTRSGNGEGVQSATFSCPDTNLASTDAIEIVWYADAQTSGGALRTIIQSFVSSQLGWGKLNAATWTLYRYSKFFVQCTHPSVFVTVCNSSIYWGDSTFTTYIDGIDYSLAAGSYAFML